VPGSAGALPPGPPPAGLSVPIRIESVAGWRISLLGARTNQCNGDLWLLAPSGAASMAASGPAGGQVFWTGYLEHLGESRLIGPFAAGTELVLGLKPAAYCTEPVPRPSTGGYARVAAVASNTWDIWWEDYRDFDFDDLVVRVEAIPLTPPRLNAEVAHAPVAVMRNYAVGVLRSLSR
jgi:hypothetical protein